MKPGARCCRDGSASGSASGSDPDYRIESLGIAFLATELFVGLD